MDIDWTQIGQATTAILLPFLGKLGETATKKVGEDLYFWLKKKFNEEQDMDASNALEQLKRVPDSSTRKAVLAETISERASKDPDGFGRSLQNQINLASQENKTVGNLVNQVLAKNVNIIDRNFGDINMN